MRILIIGAGNAGQQLAERLREERHDVVMIDVQSGSLTEVESQMDVQTFVGSGSSPRLLKEAEVDKADLVVAVTGRDEVNVLACLLAHAAGVPHKIARISDTDYIHEAGPFDLHKLGIDMVVSQKEECAHDLFNVLRLPGTIEVVDILDDLAIAAGIKVDIDSPLATVNLGKFPEPDLIRKIRFIAVQRGNKMQIPHGDTQLMIGDDVYLVGEPDDVDEFLQWAYPERQRFQKIVIAGGGDLGFHLAQLLESTRVDIVLLETDPVRATFCADRLDRTLVMKSDPLDPDTFDNVGITPTTAFVAATDDDENNIICCLLAEKRGACYTAAQVSKASYTPIISSLSLLDRAVNPYTSMVNAILRFVRGTHIESASTLYSLPGELIEVHIPADSPWAGQRIRELGAGIRGGIIAAVLRGGRVIAATGDLELLSGDRLALFCIPKSSGKILSALRGK